MAASDSAFESNNLTYSESGFNPAGSLRYTMLGASSNLCGSIYNGMQSGSTAGQVVQKGTLSSAGSMQFLHEDGGSLNFSNTTSFIRGSNATGGSATQYPPLGDSNCKVQVPQNHQHPFSHMTFDADQATKTGTFANSKLG